jgi:hypothetical protein
MGKMPWRQAIGAQICGAIAAEKACKSRITHARSHFAWTRMLLRDHFHARDQQGKSRSRVSDHAAKTDVWTGSKA